MVLFGFMVNYMLRVNFTIAIVDMVPNHKQNASIEQATNFSTSTLNDTNVSKFNIICSGSRGIQIMLSNVQLTVDCRFGVYYISDVTNLLFIISY